MLPEGRDPAHLLDMLLAARQAITFLGARDKAALEADALVLSAVEHQLIVLGEAARRVSADFKERHPEVVWSRPVGMRNVLVHDYGSIEVGEVVQTVRVDLPALVRQLTLLVPREPEV
jgi:uncharacterized protein with HEPN domain